MPWKRIMELALAITVVAGVGAGAVLWNEWQVDRDFHAAWMLLSRAKAKARESGAGPVMVRFNGPKAIVEDRSGTVIESLRLPTLAEVRYKTTRGDRMIVFSAGGGQTSPYNIHEHGGDFTFRAWTGYSRSIWVHCTGGVTEGRNNDWTLN
jgi:hypothetical protein